MPEMSKMAARMYCTLDLLMALIQKGNTAAERPCNGGQHSDDELEDLPPVDRILGG